ncbi:PD-(D/E)XK nuclease family protein [Flavobacterium sp.]|jgi:hypothetical protein|uniref:PD-(D/E)XK nuclease family protein n=1 Tax=Flavobacterium sp. TaxID=239 RepID=UPI0026241A9E|nr:PD-(D/E)XK nuclease family protein [Flavobacterium sp.]MDD2987273.1 PD-(D/E)XK nuclease family protein [Flavobacterium sp.]
MTEQQTEILSPIFKSLSVQKIKTETEQTKYNNKLLASFEKFKTIKASETLAFINTVIADYQLADEKIKQKNKTQSVLFNPLTFFPIGETMHSFLIANLIDPNASHGQGNLFLKSFLKLLDIEVFEKDNWIVTAETGRIDILLRRLHPHTVVVIENKSNYAGDQENQLYRYWFQEIYLPNHKRFGDKTVEKTSKNNNYQVIYLTPADWKLPSDHTMKRPNGYDVNLPNRIPIEPKIWLFNKQIVHWLADASEQLHQDNHRLREYIKQYIELWT